MRRFNTTEKGALIMTHLIPKTLLIAGLIAAAATSIASAEPRYYDHGWHRHSRREVVVVRSEPVYYHHHHRIIYRRGW